MSEKVYVVLSVVKKHQISVMGMKVELEMSWANGMIGVMPIFATREDAEKHANGKFEIMEVEVLK